MVIEMNNVLLPKITKFSDISKSPMILCILSEGFEPRSLAFINANKNIYLNKIIICKYEPPKESKYNELKKVIDERYGDKQNIEIMVFDRYNPYEFENKIENEFKNINIYNEIIIDISVMSKYMIMQLICSLVYYEGRVRIIYTEPEMYAPSEEDFHELYQKLANSTILPSYGVHDIIQTPLLASIIMQKSPTLLVTFLSFNEQLIRALLSKCEPSHLFLINCVPPSLSWKEKAVVDIHRNIIDTYANDNKKNSMGLLERRTSTFYYQETIDLLANIYQEHCVENRIILSPTGSKMQALGCSIIKLCCPDIHIEYPTPDSYYISGYSSSRIKGIHEVFFNNFCEFISSVSDFYHLDQ
jgi:hypothetical protein